MIEAADRLLTREEPEASEVISAALSREGVSIFLGTQVKRADGANGAISLHLADGAIVRGERLLVATGRRPSTDDLGLEQAAISLDRAGYIQTNSSLATTAAGIFAAGDATGKLFFTHAADEMGRLAVRNAFRPLRKARFAPEFIPSVTFTDPEVAHIGASEAEATRMGGRVAYLPMTDVDRALVAARTEGFVKLIAGPRRFLGNAGGGQLLGATIVSPRGGELIGEIALGMRTHMFVGRMAQTVQAYPCWSTALRQAAAQFFFEYEGHQARPASSNEPS